MIRKRIEKLIRESLEIKDIEIKIERPSNKEYGDYSSNIAMVLSKILNEHPLKIAERIRSKIEDKSPKIFEKIVVEKPGFINFYLKKYIIGSDRLEHTKKFLKEMIHSTLTNNPASIQFAHSQQI